MTSNLVCLLPDPAKQQINILQMYDHDEDRFLVTGHEDDEKFQNEFWMRVLHSLCDPGYVNLCFVSAAATGGLRYRTSALTPALVPCTGLATWLFVLPHHDRVEQPKRLRASVSYAPCLNDVCFGSLRQAFR